MGTNLSVQQLDNGYGNIRHLLMNIMEPLKILFLQVSTWMGQIKYMYLYHFFSKSN